MLGPSSVTMQHGIAVLRPGTGELARIPNEARAVAVDVTSLPESDEARKAVYRVLRAVLHESVTLPAVEFRTCNGQPDEAAERMVGHAVDQYRCVRTEKRDVIQGHGRALPIAVVVAPRLTPLAAWTAAMLRGAADALIVGADVPTKLAESRWVGIGKSGLAVRVSRFPALPDVLTADAADLASVDWAGPRRRPPGRSDRAPIVDLQRAGPWSGVSTREGDYRAALIVAYASTRTFFPYRGERVDGIHGLAEDLDHRLEEAMTYLGRDRASLRKAIRRYAEALRDGHVFLFDEDRSVPYHPGRIRVVPTGGQGLAVSQTTTPLVRLGDVVLAVGGQDIDAWLTEGSRFESGSSARVLSRLGATIGSDTPLRIRTPSGEEKAVTIPAEDVRLPAPAREDPHVPGIVYVDLAKVSPSDVPRIRESLRIARGAILDMRGYPQRPAWTVMGDLCSPDSRGPQMAELIVTPFSSERGPWQPPQSFASWTSTRQPWDGPAVMLVGPDTQSQAEHLVEFFRSRKRGKVIGQRTSGANGTITGVRLPGGVGLTFTGMIVRHHDDRPFHSLGHEPDVTVHPTVDDLVHGRDATLLRAIEELRR